MGRRTAAIAALGLGTATLLLALVAVLDDPARGLAVLGCVVAALAVGWYGLLRRGAVRAAAAALALVALSAAVVLLLTGGDVVEALLVGVAAALALAASRAAFVQRVALPRAPKPVRPVLFYNPKSGGGKAEKFALDREARARGIEPIELTAGADLEQLV